MQLFAKYAVLGTSF